MAPVLAEVAQSVIDRLRIIIIRHQKLSLGSGANHYHLDNQARLLTNQRPLLWQLTNHRPVWASLLLPQKPQLPGIRQEPQTAETKTISLSRFCSQYHRPQNKDIPVISQTAGKYPNIYLVLTFLIFRDYHLRVFSILTQRMRLTFDFQTPTFFPIFKF